MEFTNFTFLFLYYIGIVALLLQCFVFLWEKQRERDLEFCRKLSHKLVDKFIDEQLAKKKAELEKNEAGKA
jgi:hypothetical protein